MANLPAVQNEKSDKPTKEERVRLRLAEELARGVPHPELAKRLAKGDPAKAKKWRRRLRDWLYYDQAFQQMIAVAARGEGVGHLGPAMSGVGRSASRGRVDAAKLLFEATGFHSAKVNHEHSGEIAIKLNVPRPPAVEEEPVTDAEVVEDE